MNKNVDLKNMKVRAPYTREYFNATNQVGLATRIAMIVLGIEDIYDFVYKSPCFLKKLEGMGFTPEDRDRMEMDLEIFKGVVIEEKQKGVMGDKYVFATGEDDVHTMVLNTMDNVPTFDGEQTVVLDFIYCADTGMIIGTFIRNNNEENFEILKAMGNYIWEEGIK